MNDRARIADGDRPKIPAVQVLGDAVLLRGRAVLEVRSLVASAVRYSAARDGIPPNPRLRALKAALDEAVDHVAMFAEEPSEPPVANIQQDSTVMSTNQVATRLGCTEQHVRRLHRDLDARKVGRAWIFEADAVEAYAAGRNHR
jgi:hypothetical protein